MPRSSTLGAEHGVRRPVFLAGTPEPRGGKWRFEAYKTFSPDTGIAFESSAGGLRLFHAPSQGRSAWTIFLPRASPSTGVVAANDNMAMGAIEALRQVGLARRRRPIFRDRFRRSAAGWIGSPPLTTVAQPFERMANLAHSETVVAQLARDGRFQIVSLLPSRSSAAAHADVNSNDIREPPPMSLGATRLPPHQDRIEALGPKLGARTPRPS